jgi:hypothetical protein
MESSLAHNAAQAAVLVKTLHDARDSCFFRCMHGWKCKERNDRAFGFHVQASDAVTRGLHKGWVMAQKGAWAVKQMQLEAELAASGSVQGMQVCGSSHHCDMTMRTQTQDTSFCHRERLMPTRARSRRQRRLKHTSLDGFPLLLPWMLCKQPGVSKRVLSLRQRRAMRAASVTEICVGRELVLGCARQGHIGWYSPLHGS